MIGRLARPLALFTVLAALGCCAAPQPAAAVNPVKPVCTVLGLFSGLAGKLCTAAEHGKQLLSAGQKLLGGHLGGALQAITGGGGASKAVTTVATLGAIGAWVVGGAKFALSETSSIVSTTTRPQLGSSWFSSFYWRMAGVSALLTLPFLFAAAIQALVRSDMTLLLRSAFGYLPLGMLAVAIAGPVTTLLLAGSDELSRIVSGAAGGADTAFLAKAGGFAGTLSLLSRSPFIAFFVGLLTAGAALVLWCELLIRSAAVYVIVLMLPLFFAAMVWPARRVWAARAVEVLVALILSKFAIVAVLALGGAAIGHTLFPSITQMLAGATLMLLAAFSPWALLRILPLHELAAGAVGGLRTQAQGRLDLGPAEGATELAQEHSPPLLGPGEAADDPPARRVAERLDAQEAGSDPEDIDAAESGTAARSEPTATASSATPGTTASSAEPGTTASSAESGRTDPGVAPAPTGATSRTEATDPGAAQPAQAQSALIAGGPPAPAADRDETFTRELGDIVKPGIRHLGAGGEGYGLPPIEPSPEGSPELDPEPSADDGHPLPPAQEPEDGRL